MKRFLLVVVILIVIGFGFWLTDRYFPWLVDSEELVVRGSQGSYRGITDEAIYRYNLRYRSLHRLTSPDVLAGFPIWAPDHQRLAYFYHTDNGETGIRVMDVDGANDQTIFTSTATSSIYAISTFTSTVSSSIYINPDSAPMAWSPDGEYIFFDASPHGAANFFLLEVDTGNLTSVPLSVARKKGSPLELAWAPSKTLLLENDGKIYAVNIQTREMHYFVSGWSPFWTPDGKRVAYVCNANGFRGICSCNSDGTDQQLLFVRAGWNVDSEHGIYWSRDGRYLFYMQVFREDDVIFVNLFDTKTGLFHRIYKSRWQGKLIISDLVR